MLADREGQIGSVTLKNRIVMAPMISNLANPDGSTNDNHIAYLEERARGGTGLIITEYTYIDTFNSRGSRNQLGMYSTNLVPKLRRLTERVHSHGSRIFMQLVHAGGKASVSVNGVEPMAPSPVDYMGHMPREMTKEDMENVVQSFVKAAGYADQAGFDGIELHGAHGYLLQEFMSPALNRRDDSYGGNLQNRLRISQEIVDGIREKLDFPVGIRLSLYEDDIDGYDSDYGVKIAETLRNIDFVHFSAGRFAPPGSTASFYESRTHILNRLPRKPGLATMVVGSVIDRNDVESVLEKVDFVSVGRALLADPYFARKIIEEPESVRPCIRCNQGCRDLAFGEVRCTVNPSTGKERDTHLFRSEGEINIVGAGVKGLEASLTAAKMGLKVTLHEKRDEIGGQILDIYDEKKREEFLPLVGYYRYALEKLGVSVITGEEYTGDGLYCLPDARYPDLEEKEEISIDSNIFQYQDFALKMAHSHTVYMSARSISSMDRSRQVRYREMASQLGVRIVDHSERKFDISLFERDQYDISRSMVSGRNSVLDYVKRRMNLHL